MHLTSDLHRLPAAVCAPHTHLAVGLQQLCSLTKFSTGMFVPMGELGEILTIQLSFLVNTQGTLVEELHDYLICIY